jgi:hypothetical protein
MHDRTPSNIRGHPNDSSIIASGQGLTNHREQEQEQQQDNKKGAKL